MTLDVYQRAARIAGVNRGIRLDKIFKFADPQMIASERADNTHRDGLPDRIRIANCQHHIADARLFDMAQGDAGQIVQLNFQNGEVGSGSAPITLAEAVRPSASATSISSALLITCSLVIFFFSDPATTEIYTLSLHDALPISFEPNLDGHIGAELGLVGDRGQRRQQRSEEHTSELQSPDHLVCRLLLEKK